MGAALVGDERFRFDTRGAVVNVLAFDLSLTATGVAFPDGTADTWGPKLTGPARLAWFHTAVVSILDTAIDLVVIEGYSMNGQRGSLGVGQMIGELGGVVRLALHESAAPWVPVPPANLKQYATGRGNASKEEVLVAAVRSLGYEGHDNNEADALWLRAMALDFYGHPLVKMPAAHRKALTKVAWPVIDEDIAL